MLSCCLLCVVSMQGVVLWGLHGKGEENRSALRPEMSEEETPCSQQSGKWNQCTEEVKFTHFPQTNSWSGFASEVSQAHSFVNQLFEETLDNNSSTQLKCYEPESICLCLSFIQDKAWKCSKTGGLLWKPNTLLPRHATVSGLNPFVTLVHWTVTEIMLISLNYRRTWLW